MAESLQNQQQQEYLGHEGELLKFLPSNIFPLDQQPQVFSFPSPPPPPFSRHNQRNYSNYNYYHSYVDRAACCVDTQDHISQGFAAFSFVGRSPQQPPQRFNNIMPPPNLEPFRMADQRAFPGPLPEGYCVCGECIVGANQVRVRQYGPGARWPSYGPVDSYPDRNPVQTQAECFMEERARAMQAMRYHSWVNRATKNRVFPFRGGGIGGVGFVGGTGVYLPRIPANISSTAANRVDHHLRRRQGARRRHDDEAQFLMSSMVQKKKKQEDCCSDEGSPEVGLPEDWTY